MQRLERFVLVGLALGASHCARVLAFDELRPVSTTADAGEDAGAVTLSLAETFADGMCRYFEKCNPGAFYQNGLEAQCRESQLTAMKSLMSAGGTVVTMTELQACLAKLGAASCADDVISLPECRFKGSRDDGAPCVYHSQCKGGMCRRAGEVCGTCVTPLAIGEQCVVDEEPSCGLGNSCFEGHCRERGRDGTSCCETKYCYRDACNDHFRCVSSTAPFACQAPRGEGASCEVPQDCDRTKGLTCVRTGTGSTCVDTAPAAIGEKCGYRVGGGRALYFLCVRSYCKSNTCLPYVGLGDQSSTADGCADLLILRNGVCVESAPASCL